MTRLIVDMSSLVKRGLFAGTDVENGRKVEFEGKLVQVNSHLYGYDNALNSLITTMDALKLNPIDVILVVEGLNSKARRKAMYSGYKGDGGTAPEVGVEFAKARDMLAEAMRGVGAQIVTQDGVEADDVIAYLVETVPGNLVILSEDGDLSQLINERVSMWRKGQLLTDNPYGPFHVRHIRLMKALVGDGKEYPGATGFGEKAWLNLLANFKDSELDALADLIETEKLSVLEDDVEFFKPFRKVIDSAAMVKLSWDLAKLRPEWVNTERVPLVVKPAQLVETEEFRLKKYAPDSDRMVKAHSVVENHVRDVQAGFAKSREKKHAIFDIEILGKERPVFLFCAKIKETGEKIALWHHREGDMLKLRTLLGRQDLTWVSFNGINFDAPICCAAAAGYGPKVLKQMAERIIEGNAKPWHLEDEFSYQRIDLDHIDISEVAPGVRISLKAYAGRLGYPTMQDLPFPHDQDLTEDQLALVESYCFNDIGVTEALFDKLSEEISLRVRMSEQYKVDLRSKSDAQVAEAVIRSELGLSNKVERKIPKSVRYTPPAFIKTDSEVINDLIAKLKETEFNINPANGSPEVPDYMSEPIELGFGTYKVGIGGLHSTHDTKMYVKSDDTSCISDFDVSSYYPNIILKAGLVPSFDGDEDMGRKFVEVYEKIYTERITAKKAGNKVVAGSLKITLNGTFGKLGSVFSSIYSPDLLLAVTITGQLNLLCLIHELEKINGVMVLSANTDGIMVRFGKSKRQSVLDVIKANEAMTGFEYEETPYSKVALKDLNNYIALTVDGKVKRKGLYAERSLMKNPTMQVCSNMVVDYLRDGVEPAEAIKKYSDILDFVAIRGVKGGGIQPQEEVEVDDWVLVKDLGTKDNEWARPGWEGGRCVKRKSRPKPVIEYRGGTSFGRIARWYMSTTPMPPIVYCGSGNKVPKTEGARLLMDLPQSLPDDIDYEWYVNETLSILSDLGVRK